MNKKIDEKDIKIINYTKFFLKDDSKDSDNYLKFCELIKDAYKKLKLASYYERYPLNYRLQIARFESEGNIDVERKIEDIAKILFPLTQFEINSKN